jgi:hypothetical protein
MARPQLVPALGQVGTVRHSSGAHHFGHAGCVLVYLLLCAYRALSGLAYGRLCDTVHDGTCLLARA